jgi:hypothetical protein
MEIESGEEPPTKATPTRQDPGTGVLGQATTGNPPTEAGEDDDDDILALSNKRSGKKRANLSSSAAAAAIQGKSASRISSPASSVPGSHMRGPVAARSGVPSKTSSSDSDSDSPRRPNKRARAKGQDRDGDDDDSDDGAKRGDLRWRGTKQPVKRVARRF